MVLGALALFGCYSGLHGDAAASAAEDGGDDIPGTDEGDGGESEDGAEPAADDGEVPLEVPVAGLRRLTRHEVANALTELVQYPEADVSLLPGDTAAIFDNAYADQVPSAQLVSGLSTLALAAADHVLADPQRRAAVLGCTPSAPDDAACFESFVRSFGRRVLRRPLPEDDVARFVTLLSHAEEDEDFDAAVRSAIRALLLDPRFIYRVEVGTPVEGRPGLLELDAWEVATRLALLLWEGVPDPWLLDQAEAGALADSPGIRAVAVQMLDDERAHATIRRFHAQWLGYAEIGLPDALAIPMAEESAAIINRVLFDEGRPWQDIFTLDQTYVTPALAEHYGLGEGPAGVEGQPRWWDYAGTSRGGILSTGAVLSAGASGSRTNPTLRGLDIRERLFCQTLELPEGEVPEPVEPGPAECKPQALAAHASGGCADCHAWMDPVGFGLEEYDVAGRYRTFEPDKPQCEIDGIGEMAETGDSFHGPKGLGEFMADSPSVQSCITTQLLRFALGRAAGPGADAKLQQRLVATQDAGALYFDELLVELAADSSFRFRQEES